MEQIKIRNSTLAEKYQNSLYALLDTTFLSHTLSDFIKQICQDLRYFSPEIIDLLHTANNLKSLWCHQKELVLFSYGNNETQTVHDDHYTPKENKSTPLIPKTWPLCICYK